MRLNMCKLIIFILTSFPALSFSKVLEAQNVKEVISDLSKYKDQLIKVHGEVEKVIGPKVFILESGGFINNEITVSGEKNLNPEYLKEGKKLEVTGELDVIPYRTSAGRKTHAVLLIKSIRAL